MLNQLHIFQSFISFCFLASSIILRVNWRFIQVIIFIVILYSANDLCALPKILIYPGLTLDSANDPALESLIKNNLSSSLGNSYEIEFTSKDFVYYVSNKAELKDYYLFIEIYYNTYKIYPPDLYAVIFQPEELFVIDAISVTTRTEILNNIKVNEEEFNIPREEKVKEFTKKIEISLKINQNRELQNENIVENITNQQLGKKKSFPLKKIKNEDKLKSAFLLVEDMVVVTATRSKAKLKDAPAAVYVVTENQIKERGYRTLVDALSDIPGFDFQHTSGVYPELVHQRGLIGENQRTLVYIDGIPDNNISGVGALGGTLRFPLRNVDRIEVVSGPASSIYGANAFNGIINIITKDGKDKPGNHVEVTYGNYGSNFTSPGYETSFSARGKATGDEKISYSVGGYYYKTDGPNFGGLQRLDKSNYSSYDANYYLEQKACGGVCNATGDSRGYDWSKGYNNSKEDTYNITGKFTKGGLRFQTVNWQHLTGHGTFINGNYRVDTKEEGLDTGNYDERNNFRRLGILLGYLGNKKNEWLYRDGRFCRFKI